jgi:photosystem II stability/assembly factor-like uncharacterized protein
MKRLQLSTLLLVCLLLNACSHLPTLPSPTEIFENEEGEQEGGYRKYFEETRRAALGDDWKRITNENLENNSLLKRNLKKGASSRESFAGGAVQGDWYERGGSTVSGSMTAIAFHPATEEVFAMSSSGTVYKGSLSGGSWAIQNDDENFDNEILTSIPYGAGKRLLAAKNDQKIYYSDNDGVTWTASSGITNPYSWGAGGKKLVVFNNGTMYYLQHTWNGSPWGSSNKIYRSTDNGQTWALMQTFGTRNEDQVMMWSPYKSDELYIMDNGTTLYSLSGTASTLSVLTTNTNIATASSYRLSGYKNGAALTLYALVNSANLYKSTDNGATWASMSTLNPTSWNVGIHANPWVADAIYYGAVNFRKSADGGATFTDQNGWGSYYGNTNLLHADIVAITPFEKTDGSKFILIGNHGGVYYFPSAFTTTTNLTTAGVTNAEYYDVVTVSGTIFAGAQDQGNQRFAGGAGTGILTASQLISGDYVRLNSSVNGTKYWQEYPGGVFHYYNSPLTQQNTSAQGTVYGTARTNIQQWVVPTCNWSVAAENSILVGGGTAVSGATGSYVVKMTYNGTSTLVKTQYAYDFLTNGGGYISAIDHSPADANYMYVGLNNGKFYYSQNAGSTWTQTAGFTGATNGWNYGSFIHASRLNKNIAYFCGAGGKIYKTINGGVSFTDMSAGLANTFVSELALNGTETLLFAATDAGPYVCVLSTGQWYNLTGVTTPIKEFTSVEYVASGDLMRFSTFGRGVWDFKITQQPLPITYVSFDAKSIDNQKVSVEWRTELESNLAYFEVERSANGVDFFPIKKINPLNKPNRYAITDDKPLLNATNYYRVKSVENSGEINYTNIKAVSINRTSSFVHVYPTILENGKLLNVEIEAENAIFYLFDQQGKIISQQKLQNASNTFEFPFLPKGTYFYAVQNENKRLIKSGKMLLIE